MVEGQRTGRAIVDAKEGRWLPWCIGANVHNAGFRWCGFLSMVFVGHELKHNNDLAVIQSQYELLALNVEMND